MTGASDVEILREAAARMRALADAATSGPWVVFDMDEAQHRKDEPLNEPGQGWYWVWAASRLPHYGGILHPERDHPEAIIGSAAIDDAEGGLQEQADATFVAAMHPVVALAVADWLDSVGDSGMPPDSLAHSRVGRTICEPDWQAAMNLARTFLGVDA